MSRAGRTVLIASLVLIPLLPLPAILLHSPGPEDPPLLRPVRDFDVSKWALASFAAALALAAVASPRRSGPSAGRRLPPGALPLAGLVLLAALSAAWAENPHEAWRSAARLFVLASMFLLLGTFVGATRTAAPAGAASDPRSSPSISPTAVAAAVAASAALVALYGILQKAGWDFPSIPWRFLRRPVSTLGNTNIASEFLVVAIPLIVGLLAVVRRPFVEAVLGIALTAALTHLAITGTRAGWISLAVAVVTGGALLAAGLRAHPPDRGDPLPARKGWILGASGLAAVALLSLPALEGGRVLEDAGTIPSLAHPSTRVRLRIWESTGEMIAEHPLLGVGAGNFAVEYPRYRTAAELDLSGYLSRVDTAHNDYLELAAELGVAGLLLWIAFAGTVFLRGLAPLREAESPADAWLRAAAGAGIAAFFANQAFRSPLHNPAAVVAFGVAASVWLQGRRESGRRGVRLPRGVQVVAIPAALLIAFGVAASWAGRLAADAHARLAQGWQESALREGPGAAGEAAMERAVRAVERALAADPRDPELWSRLGRYLGTLGRRDEAVRAYRRAVALRPHDPAALSSLAVALDETGRRDEAKPLLEEALRLAPHHPVLRFNEGILLRRTGRWKEAILAFERSATLRPRHARTYDELRECYERVDPGTYFPMIAHSEARKRVCEALDRIDEGRLAEADEILRRAEELSSETVEARWLRGLVLAKLGRADEAVAEIRAARSARLPVPTWIESEGTVQKLREDANVRAALEEAGSDDREESLRR
jgi:Flp pilus assembly protein TadD/O-antigen ligase